jgi:branched-subunit amino acid transport protein
VSNGSALLVLVAATIGTYLTRVALIVTIADRTLPASVERALQNVGPAVLAALTINLAVGSDGVGAFEFAEVAALIVACVVAVWRSSLIWTFLAGMLTLWVLSPHT